MKEAPQTRGLFLFLVQFVCWCSSFVRTLYRILLLIPKVESDKSNQDGTFGVWP